MTITTEPAPLSYSGDDSTVNFSITWKYFAKSDVVATLRSSAGAETTWVLDTDYTLTAAGVDTGGTLTATTAPATGETLVISLDPPNTQDSSLPLGGAFPSSTVEDELDQAAQRDAKIEALFNRALRVPKTDTRSGSQLELPNETDRASKFLGFDANGDPVASSGSVGGVTVSSFMETVLDDTTAAAVRTTIGAGTLSNVSEDTTPQLGGDLDINSKFINGNLTSDTDSTDDLGTTSVRWANVYTDAIGDTGQSLEVKASDLKISDGVLLIKEQADADADQAGFGQLWVNTATPNELYFTNDAGTDKNLSGAATLTLDTELATTSGTSKSFTAPASGIKGFILMLDGVSTNGTSNLMAVIGDSGGLETTGYVSAVVTATSGGSTNTDFSTGFGLTNALAAADTAIGHFTFTHMGSNSWLMQGVSLNDSSGTNDTGYATGAKTLSAELTTVQIQAVNGTDEFDAGAVNIQWIY